MVSVAKTSLRSSAFNQATAHHPDVEEDEGVGSIIKIDIGSSSDSRLHHLQASSPAISALKSVSETDILIWLRARGFYFNPFAHNDGGLDPNLHAYNFSNQSPLEQSQPRLAVHESRVVLGASGSGKTTKMLRIQNDLNRSFPKILGVQFILTWDLVEATRADAWAQAMAKITKSVARASLALSALPIADPNSAHQKLEWDDAGLARWINLLDIGIGRFTWLAEVKDAVQRQSTELLFELADLDYTYRDLQSKQLNDERLDLLRQLVNQADYVPVLFQDDDQGDDDDNDSTIPACWRILRDFCNACQLEHLVIMVKDFSKHFGKQINKALAALDSIVARMMKDQTLGGQLSVQCFFDSQTEAQLGKALKRLPVYRLGWSEHDLRKLIKRRLAAAQSSADTTQLQSSRHANDNVSLDDLFGCKSNLDGERSSMDHHFIAQSNLSPQRLVELVNDHLHTVVQQALCNGR